MTPIMWWTLSLNWEIIKKMIKVKVEILCLAEFLGLVVFLKIYQSTKLSVQSKRFQITTQDSAEKI